MHYVKHFDINGVDTKQVACIELHGKPNAATEGHVGVLGIDMDSPTHDVYKCCAVNGSIYTWELLSSGMSIINTPQSAGGARWVAFSYDNLKIPRGYVVKAGDLILDNEGYLYQIDAIETIDSYLYCSSEYTGTRFTSYVEKIVTTEFIGEDENGGNIYRQTFEDGYESDFVAPKGQPGTPGESAYDIAVSHGFEGTEEEWLDSISEKELNKNVLKMQSNLDSTTKRVTNLEAAVYGDLAQENEDNSLAYVKDVPQNALPFAEVKAIGGMTRKCANLLPYPYADMNTSYGGGNMVANADGGVSFSGTPTSLAYLYLYHGAPLKGVVTLSAYGSFSNVKAFLTLKNANNDIIYDEGSTGSITCDLDAYPSATVMEIALIRQYNNVAISGTCYPMLNAGSTALPYEPYFEGLRSAAVTEIESVGVNKFDINNRQLGTIDSNGDLKCEESTGTFYRYPFKENTQYTLSGYVKNHNTTGNVRFRVVYTDGTSENAVLLNGSTEWAYRTYTTEAGKTVDRITLWHGDVGYMYIKGGELMINEGTTALPYTPYVKHTLPIPEAVRALDGYGEGINAKYNNHIRYEEDGRRTYIPMVKRIIFDGVTEGKKMDTTDVQSGGLSSYYAYMVPEGGNPPPVHASPTVSSGDVGVGTITVLSISVKNSILGLEGSPTQIQITSAINKYLNDMYLSGKPVEVVYAVQKPEVTDISDILPADNLIGVEGGGTLTFKNEYEYDVPSEVTFVTKGASA